MTVRTIHATVYGHCKLPGEELSYDMTEEEAEELLRKVLEERHRPSYQI
jgi:hypothetical protein